MPRSLPRPRFVRALLLALAGGTLAAHGGEPAVWITLGADALPAVQEALRGDGPVRKAERIGDIALLRVSEGELARVSKTIHESFRRCPGFISHDSREAALASLSDDAQLLATQAAFLAYSIDNGAVVQGLMAELREAQIRSTITTLSNFTTRHYTSTTGVQAANWVRDTWAGLAQGRSDVSVQLFTHPTWAQPSVIATIQGTAQPSEIVVMGAHLDSINRNGGTTAPGADDDASGVATLTNVLRAAMLKGYRPQKTVKLMAYAAEEVGLRGSREIATAHRNANANVVGVLQLDMTNFKGSSVDIVILTDNTNAPQNQFLEQLVDTYVGVPRGTTACGYGCSDHASWTNQGYPASLPFEALFGQHNMSLHTVNDTLARSGGNANHALKFAKLAAAYMAELAKGGFGGGGGDTTPPTASLTAPVGGATVSGTVNVTATASDNVGVTQVDFLVDGALAGSDTSAPYAFAWNSTGVANGAHTLRARALDAAGNQGLSATVNVTVNNGTGGGDLTAVFDAALQAPKCAAVGRSCDSGASLLRGRDGRGPEPNQPNTIADSCADGTSGTFHADESNDRVRVATTDGTPFAAGKTVRIEATVWAWTTPSADRLDLYRAANANSPSWVLVATLTPSAAGAQTLSATYTLPAGSLQAVRARFRYQGTATPCATGSFIDHDDLVFAVQ